MNKKAFFGAAAMGLVCGGYALAQTVEGIDVGAIRAQADTDVVDQEAFVKGALARGEGLEGDAEETVNGAQNAARERIGKLRVGSDGLVNFDEILADAGELQSDVGQAPQFIVFASLSMPENSLRALIGDTGRAGGAVVFRGFPGNSMRVFQQGIMKVVDNNDDFANIGIDPRLFRAFDVKSVPTFVAVSGDFDPCDGFDCKTDVPAFDRMSGNVTVSYVLDVFVEGNGPGAQVARVAKARLESKGS